MTVYVLRDGKLVEKRLALLADAVDKAERSLRDEMLGLPMISRIDPYESPVTGKEITSWRQREADLAAADAYDPRDLAPGHVYPKGRNSKEAKDARPDKHTPFQWGGPGD
jgi:hypothetical protein